MSLLYLHFLDWLFAKTNAYRIFPFTLTLTGQLKKYLADCKTILDIGCGWDSPLKSFSRHYYMVGVDAYKKALTKSKKRKIHNKYIQALALDIEKKVGKKSYDSVIAIEIIEHMTKKEGYKLIAMMERIAKKKSIIFMPNGFIPQDAYDANPWQIHKSGWTVSEMKQRGYKVVGIRGWKKLRGELSHIKYKPVFLFYALSLVSELIVFFIPSQAFQLFCVKDMTYENSKK